jgi:hypothetical protein
MVGINDVAIDYEVFNKLYPTYCAIDQWIDLYPISQLKDVFLLDPDQFIRYMVDISDMMNETIALEQTPICDDESVITDMKYKFELGMTYKEYIEEENRISLKRHQRAWDMMDNYLSRMIKFEYFIDLDDFSFRKKRYTSYTRSIFVSPTPLDKISFFYDKIWDLMEEDEGYQITIPSVFTNKSVHKKHSYIMAASVRNVTCLDISGGGEDLLSVIGDVKTGTIVMHDLENILNGISDRHEILSYIYSVTHLAIIKRSPLILSSGNKNEMMDMGAKFEDIYDYAEFIYKLCIACGEYDGEKVESKIEQILSQDVLEKVTECEGIEFERHIDDSFPRLNDFSWRYSPYSNLRIMWRSLSYKEKVLFMKDRYMHILKHTTSSCSDHSIRNEGVEYHMESRLHFVHDVYLYLLFMVLFSVISKDDLENFFTSRGIKIKWEWT